MSWIAPVLGTVAQLGGSLGGQALSEADRQKELEIYKQLLAKYQNVPLPGQEQMSPDLYGPSALEGISEDPTAGAAYAQSDAAMKGLIDQGGLTLQDKAAQASVYDKLARQNSTSMGRIENDAAARGGLNSGSTLAMQLASQQQGSQQAADAARDTSANAQARMYQALRDRASQSMKRSDQVYDRQARAAAARDAINQHNASAMNKSISYNNDLGQTQFGNRMSQINGQQNASGNLASYYGGAADRISNMWGGSGKAVQQGIAAYDQRRRDEEDY
jgi:hypothetical protein